MISVTPIEDAHLAEVGAFLHTNLNRRILPDAWVAALSHAWGDAAPNHGMQLRDDGRLVGVFCAIYSDQWIDGRLERFCNPHSWCVLNDYRSSSISLILQILKQPGYHFTMFTPNPKVAEIFRGLRFRDLDDGLVYFANLPALPSHRSHRILETDPDRIAARLDEPRRRDFMSHRSIPWLRFVAFGRAGDVCLAVYKRGRWKQMPCAHLIHVSDPGALERHGGLLRHHLLVHGGMPFARIERRLIGRPPGLSITTRRTQPKLAFSRTLRDDQIVDLYSELVALDV